MVSKSGLSKVVEHLASQGMLAVDTETTGLRVWTTDRLFSIVIADTKDEYYFNFQNYEGLDPEFLLDDPKLLQPIFSQINCIYYLANAKFDLAALHRVGLRIEGKIHDVLVMNRILYNEHMSYSLDECAKRMGLKKDDAVESFIEKNHMWQWEDIPGKKTRLKKKFFDRVPTSIIVPYGKRDARITMSLGIHTWNQLEKTLIQIPTGKPTPIDVAQNEFEITKTCFEMEKVGVKIDKEYCEKAIAFESENCRAARETFEKLSGKPFVDSNKALAEVFAAYGVEGFKTEKGNPSFTEASLEAINKGPASPIAKAVLDHRESFKKCATYYQSFLYYSSAEGTLHATIRQAGTATGRFSYSDPNLQNVPKEEAPSEFKVRKAFVPRETFCFVEFDYKAFEYRLMVEYAGELELIEKIKAGIDVHEATAQMMKVSRKTAKTLNFMLLYGGGAQKLAEALNLSLEEARNLKNQYFSALPNVRQFIWNVTKAAETRGFIFNWLGRRCYFPDKTFAYKAPNALIQGGTADIVKVAMNRIRHYLTENMYKSRMVLQVHDSILFEIHESEFHILPEIKKILESAYPGKYLKMEVSSAHSFKSWAELVDGLPA